MKKFIIGICSVGIKYNNRTKKLINQINEIIDVNVLILTDEPKEFDVFKNVIIKQYNYKKAFFDQKLFSYHDKNLIFEEGFKISDSVLLLDADHSIREENKNLFVEFDSNELNFGAYPQFVWKSPASCSIENFLEGLTPRVPYGKEFKKYCLDKNYGLEGSQLIQESFLFIKETPEKISKFLSTWKDLQKFCEQKDIERNQRILGYGEGYSIGISLKEAGIKIIENNRSINKLTKSLKHFAWEPEQ